MDAAASLDYTQVVIRAILITCALAATLTAVLNATLAAVLAVAWSGVADTSPGHVSRGLTFPTRPGGK
jgi:hypothetical protein